MVSQARAKKQHSTKRAAIYVRTSSEKQAEKVSPEAQEADARALCERQGFIVIEVYRDIEKYRANGRLVEPSGTRNDRPQFKRMLADADAGRFDVIIAWREDRLYRGVNRAMLEISERVKAKSLEVELVKEHYDPAIAEVKAWAAGVELQAKHDRHVMGVAGRLAAGKVWGFSPPYGYDYDKDTGKWVVNEDEARFVRLVWRWFGEGLAVKEIQRRLIASGARQKGKTPRKRRPWGYSVIRNFIQHDEYFTGEVITDWDGVEYRIAVPVLIDRAAYQAAKGRLARFKAYPSGNYKQYAIAAGLVHCPACEVRMSVIKHTSQGKPYYYYRCVNEPNGAMTPDCSRYINLFKADDEIWRKVWKAISNPEELEAKINARIAQLQAERADAQGDCEQIAGKLNEIVLKRQQAIAWALNGIISQDDLKMQLTGFDWQTASLQHELAEASLLTGDRETKIRAIAEDLRAKVDVGRELLAIENPTPEQQQDIFNFKREIVQGLAKRIEIHKDQTVTVQLELDDHPTEDDDSLPINNMASLHSEWGTGN